MKILILGLGKSTSFCLKYFSQQDEIYIYDEKNGNISYEELKEKMPLFDLCIRSPGIKSTSNIYLLSKMLSKKVISEIEFFVSKIKTKHIILVSGSVGKTSLCMLIESILNIKYKTLYLGNANYSLGSRIEEITSDTILILELSSFQLEDTTSIKGEIVIITNFYENHLDSVINKDYYFASKKRMLFNKPSLLITSKNGEKYLKEYSPLVISASSFKEEVAALVASFYSLTKEEIKKGKDNYVPPRFRNEIIKNKNRLIVNDSKSTCVESTSYCLKKFDFEERIIILGGIHKSSSFLNLKIKEKDKIYTFGKDGKKIASILNGKYYKTLEEIIISIQKEKKDIPILFSPGCSSFDQFKDYKNRGEVFERLVSLWL